jgi:hypothetical protein
MLWDQIVATLAVAQKYYIHSPMYPDTEYVQKHFKANAIDFVLSLIKGHAYHPNPSRTDQTHAVKLEGNMI